MTALLEVEDLRVSFGRTTRAQQRHEVLHGVSFEVRQGETLGLVGESGSGKTTIGRAILGLARVSAGSIRYRGEELSMLSEKRRRVFAKELQVVFQDPYSSLNPAMTIEEILSEPLLAAGRAARTVHERVAGLVDDVGLPSTSLHRLPNEFSGGQRQRIAIARALALDPRLIVCDEPVSALDMTTQADVLDLLIGIQNETGVAYLFISHDLAVVRHISHRVAVLYRGDIVETGPAATLTRDPAHPYTKQLVLASPVTDPDAQALRRARRHEVNREASPFPERSTLPTDTALRDALRHDGGG